MHTPKRLIACPSCGCHHHLGEPSCPHCGTAPSGRAAAALLLGLSLATGCDAGGKEIALYGVAVTWPIVSITAPEDGATVTAGDVEVDGTVEDSEVADLSTLVPAWTLDDAATCAEATVDASGETSCVVTLSEGDHTVGLSVVDPGTGESGEASITLTAAAADTGG